MRPLTVGDLLNYANDYLGKVWQMRPTAEIEPHEIDAKSLKGVTATQRYSTCYDILLRIDIKSYVMKSDATCKAIWDDEYYISESANGYLATYYGIIGGFKLTDYFAYSFDTNTTQTVSVSISSKPSLDKLKLSLSPGLWFPQAFSLAKTAAQLVSFSCSQHIWHIPHLPNCYILTFL